MNPKKIGEQQNLILKHLLAGKRVFDRGQNHNSIDRVELMDSMLFIRL